MSSTRGLSCLEKARLGVSPCDLIFPENSPETSAAHDVAPVQDTGNNKPVCL